MLKTGPIYIITKINTLVNMYKITFGTGREGFELSVAKLRRFSKPVH